MHLAVAVALFFFSSRRRHTRWNCDWSSDVCSSDLYRRAITAASAVPYLRDYKTDSFAFVGEGIQQLTGYSAGEITPRLWESMVQETFMRGAAAGLSMEEAIRRTDRKSVV